MNDLARAFGSGISTSEKVEGDSDEEPRCWRCGRLLAELVSRPWVIKCGRCKARNEGRSGYQRAMTSGPGGSADDDV